MTSFSNRPPPRMGPARFTGALVGLLLAVSAAAGAAEVRVCADPDNLPFSNDRREGFENKIAELVAADMHATVRYTWVAERSGFVRATLKAMSCDLVAGVPDGFDAVLATKPYYRSTYVFVYAKDRHLKLSSFDDPALRHLKIGVPALGDDGANTPPVLALARRHITGNIVGFPMGKDGENPAVALVDAVAAGKVDVAVVWGPFAGYFARRAPVALEVVPVSPASDPPGVPFVYDMAMGVRPGDVRWKAHIDGILDRHRDDILRILKTYDVPLVDAPTLAAAPSAGGGAHADP